MCMINVHNNYYFLMLFKRQIKSNRKKMFLKISMSWNKEIISWINSLQQEIQGLDILSRRITSNKGKSSQIESRLVNVIALLKKDMLNIIEKSNALLKVKGDPSKQTIILRKEYQKVMKSLINLLETINDSVKNPRYNNSNPTSCKRSSSKNDTSLLKHPDKNEISRSS